MSVAAVVLAAGGSRRLGRPKQYVVLGGETLLERAVRVASEAGLKPLIVVVAADAEEAAWLRERGCVVVANAQANEGLAASIRCGVDRAGASGAEGAVLMTCDQVGLRVEHLRALCRDVARVRGSFYAGKTGVPAYFPASSFGELLKLRGEAGARDLLRGAESVVDEALSLDIDTEADLELARRLLVG